MRTRMIFGVVVILAMLFGTAFSAEVTAPDPLTTQLPGPVDLGHVQLLLPGDDLRADLSASPESE